MGKKNVFGSIEEISRLVEEVGCSACIDVAHVLARYGDYKFEEIVKAFRMKRWHLHFSGIEYGEKGEKKHLKTNKKEWGKILDWLEGLNKDVVLICESPDPVGDSVEGLGVWERNKLISG
jgi:deoxyribonuclease-4